jgi:tetratricopeptide (TPR) repeat protein/tRNA A-37 threonylcarbamoyl transferase component Bud32
LSDPSQDDVRRIRELLEKDAPGGETSADEDLSLGRLALDRNLIRPEQLIQAGREIREARTRGENSSLGSIFLKNGWIPPDDLLRLAADQARLAAAAPKLDRYEVRECIGEGASAVVYRAWDRELKRLVAVKALRAAAGMSSIARSRFKREASAAAALVHPNVVAVYDAAEEDGRPYLVMELIEGRTLLAVLKEGSTPKKDLIGILEQAARGVAAAHEKGIVHRDLKPANILVAADGSAKVADFGLAHLMDSDSALTRSGAELGTPYYMSPEQVDGRSRESTPATDVYALGAILYELLSGSPPHARPSLQETFAAILSQDPVPLRSSDPKIHRDLETICFKALEKDPRRRYAGAREFADDLRAYLSGDFISAVPVPPWKRRLRRALKNRALVAALLLIVAVSAVAVATLVRQSVASRRNLEAERELARRREAALQRLGTAQSTLLERDRELRQQRVPAQQARRDLEAALAEVDRIVTEWPDSPQGYYVRGRGKMLLGDLDGAERDLKISVAKAPDFRPGWSLLGILRVGDYQSKLEGPQRTHDERIKSLAPLLEEAKTYFVRGWQHGKELEESARWGLPWTREDQVMQRLARAFQLYFNDGDGNGAIALLREGDQQYQAEEYAMWIGLLSGIPEQRARWLDLAIQRAPGFLPPYYYRAMYALAAGAFRAGLPDLDFILSRKTSFAWAWSKRSEAKRSLGDLEGALADCLRAIELDPKLQEAWLHRGAVYAQLGKKEESLAAFDQAIALLPDSAEALANRAIARQMFDDPDGAFKDFDLALQLDPKLGPAWRSRGIAFIRKGKYPEALADLDRAVQLEPRSFPSLEARGVARNAVGDISGGIKDWEEALRLAPAEWPKRKQIEGMLERAKARLKDKNE